NISSSISVSDVANYVCISSRQLNRILKNALDITTNDLINELKIKAAKVYMKNPTLSISQISVMCGFNSLTHFNLTFKKLTGHTPKAFRQFYISG
ncbi:MAG: helix-turn-helix transcriptional regulator, partial [Clostridia bacterium]|nr:helix-turn-helix transcriptional regulator [Clostridia bacterium]